MCGIVGYLGNKSCKNILLSGLKKLEYRGFNRKYEGYCFW